MQARSWIRILVVVFFMLLIAKAGIHLVSVIQLEAQEPVDIDYLLDAVVGRGILNGITPYIDLFEGRPPGMFFLSALSMTLTSGARLANAVQVFFLAMLPFLPVLFVAARERWKWKSLRATFLILVAFLTGTLLTLYMEEVGAVLQTEFFGAAFGCLYVLTIAGGRQGSTKIRIAFSSLFLLCSIGFKEPFLLTTCAAAVLLSEKPRDIVRLFILPLAIALTVGTLFLFLAGWLPAYTGVYLRTMLESRLGTSVDPFFLRGLSVRRLYAQLIPYAHSPVTGIFIALLFASFPLLHRKNSTSWYSTILTLSFGVASFFFLHGLYDVAIFFVMRHRGITDSLLNFPFWMNPLSLAVFAGVWIPLCILQYRDSRIALLRVALAMGSLVLVALAIGAGGTYNAYHFGFGIPVYFALTLLFLRSMSELPSIARVPVHMLIVVFVILAIFSYRQNPHVREYILSQLQNTQSANESRIAAVDGMLDACHIDRYFSVNTTKHLAFARHSPIGPMPEFNAHFYLKSNHPLYARTVTNIMRDAQVLLFEGDKIDGRFEDFLLTKFTGVPPDCAKPFLPIPDISVAFRKAGM